MKKKILFTGHRMNVGGVEKAMLSLMKALGPEYDIHLAIMFPEGDFMKAIPPYVSVHTIGGFTCERGLVTEPKREIPRRLLGLRWRTGIPAAWHYLKAHAAGSLNSYIRWLLRDNRPGGRFADPVLDGEFDLAIDFPGPPGEHLEYYATQHVRAHRRCAWIHFDLDRVLFRMKSSRATYSSVDRVFCVSENVLRQFREKFPEFAGKGRVLHNIVDREEILDLGREKSDYVPQQDALNIVTVGRLSPEKGTESSLRALRYLADHGHNVCWHFVGNSNSMETYRAMAGELGVERLCRFYGPRLNPYPFMRGADVYVQPSRHEGYGITVKEASLFGMPIVATDFPAAREELATSPNIIILPTPKAADAKASSLTDVEMGTSTDTPEEIAALAEAIIRASALPHLGEARGIREENKELEELYRLLEG